jgi:glycosyltransferase involved in cell wall biosynthesis
MPNQPKVSVIIVTYNAVKTLQAALDTIYSQTYPNIEVVVIDGLSTDGTVEILKANDAKIAFWKSEKDTGVYDAMNKAVTQVTGEWVYFLGADDELLPEFSDAAGINRPNRYLLRQRICRRYQAHRRANLVSTG